MFSFLRRLWDGPRVIPPLTGPDAHEPRGVFPQDGETLLFTEPRDERGYVDYHTALNDHLRGSITPEENVLTALWEWGATSQLVPSGVFFRGISLAKVNLWLHFGTRTAWKPADEPMLTAWLRANEHALAAAVEASKRPAYFCPFDPPEGERRGLVSGPLHVWPELFRQYGTLLSVRACLWAGDGNSAQAWEDVFAALRLGRHMSRGGTLFELLCALAIEAVASESARTVLEASEPTAAEVRA